MFLMAPFVVVYDASVMYPVRVVDLLIRLAQKGFVEAKWTDDIHEEWIRSLLKDRPDLTREQLERRRAAMDSAVRDCLVTDYEPLIESVELIGGLDIDVQYLDDLFREEADGSAS